MRAASKVATDEIVKKWLAPAMVGTAAATQSEDSDASFAGLRAVGANLAGAKAAHGVFREHMRIDPNIFTDFDSLIESGVMQGRAAQEAGNKNQYWFIGPDGKPRYEINDANASIDKDFTKGMVRQLLDVMNKNERQHVAVPMNMVVNHEPLYNAYPYLRDTPVNLWKPGSDLLGDTPAAWTPPRDGSPMGDLHLNLGPVLDIKDRNETLRSLLHEAQHGIQDFEGFARGAGNPAAMGDLSEYIAMPNKHGGTENFPRDNLLGIERVIQTPKIDRAAKVVEAVERITGDPDIPDVAKEDLMEDLNLLAYILSSGEAEARAVENRLRMPAKLRVDHGHPYGDIRMPRDLAEYFYDDEGPTSFGLIEMLTRPEP